MRFECANKKLISIQIPILINKIMNHTFRFYILSDVINKLKNLKLSDKIFNRHYEPRLTLKINFIVKIC